MQTFTEPYLAKDVATCAINALKPYSSYILTGGTIQNITWPVVRIVAMANSYIAINSNNDLSADGVGTYMPANVIEWYRLDRIETGEYVKCLSGQINVTIMK